VCQAKTQKTQFYKGFGWKGEEATEIMSDPEKNPNPVPQEKTPVCPAGKPKEDI
jgi:hypothetical protein